MPTINIPIRMTLVLGLMACFIAGCSDDDPTIPLDATPALPCVDYASGPQWISRAEGIGYPASMAWVGDYAYVANIGGMSLIHYLDPAAPSVTKVLGEYETHHLTAHEDHLYVARGYQGLGILNIENPADPAPIAALETGGQCVNVVVEGRHAYVAEWPEKRILIVDISTPATPSLVGEFPTGQISWNGEMSIDSGRLAVVGEFEDLRVFDVSDPQNVALLTSISITRPGSPQWSEGLLYVVEHGPGLPGSESRVLAYDFAEPTTPLLIGQYVTEDGAGDLALDDDRGYLALSASAGSVAVLDISNPSKMRELGRDVTVTTPYEIQGRDGRALVSVIGYEELHLLDLEFVAAQETPLPDYQGEPGLRLAVSGDLAVVGTSGHRVQILELGKSTKIDLLGECDLVGRPTDIALRGDHAVVAVEGSVYGGLQIVDVSSPASPEALGSTMPVRFPQAVALAGNIAYVACTQNGLALFDIEDPNNPVYLESLSEPAFAEDIVVRGDRALVAGGQDGLFVFDVSDPADPNLLDIVEAAGWSGRIEVDQNTAYITNHGPSLDVYDVTSFENPAYWGSTETPGPTFALAAAGGHLYLASSLSGVRVYEFDAPATLTPIGGLPGRGHCLDIVATDQGALVADMESSGVYFVPFQCGN